MRLTIQYGPWSPDLANVPFQYQDQPGPLIVPAADCLNVYYANGAYKSISTPSSAVINGTAVRVLSSQVLNALSFFDNVQQQKSVFAGISSGVSQLNINGTWTALEFFSNQASININSVSFWSFAELGPYVIAVPYTPLSTITGPYLWSDQGLSGNGNAFSEPVPSTTSIAPGGRIGAVVGQFLMLGDILDAQTQVIATGDGSTVNFSALLSNTPMLASGSVYDSAGTITGTFANGLITGTGLASPSVLPGTSASLNTLMDVYAYPGGAYANSVFAVNSTTDPTQSAFTSLTANSVTELSVAASYSYVDGVATWVWTGGSGFGFAAATTYAITFVGGSFGITIEAQAALATTFNGYSPYTHQALYDNYPGGVYANSIFQLNASSDPGKSLFGSLLANGVTQTSASATYSYAAGVATWSWEGATFGFVKGSSYPVTFTSAPSGFFSTMTAGFASFGTAGHTFTDIYGFFSTIAGSDVSLANLKGFQQSTPIGAISSGINTINYTTGALVLSPAAAPANGDIITASYTRAAPYRVWWSAIGDPTNWPIPLTANAIAFQSGYQDLNPAQGPVMFIAGYPLYGLIFQLTGITRANYVGGDVVFTFGLYSQNRGLTARGAAIQVGTLVYFLSQDGFFVTDGNSISSIGTDQNNNAGIDNWFWANVNQAALSAISCAYDDTTRCIYFAIPTGANTLPDTLLTYNPVANRWTRAAIATELIFTDDNGSTVPANEIRLGLFTQNHQYSSLLGTPVSGYLESCDLMPVDGSYRFTSGLRPNVACTDAPKGSIGVRNSMQDSVTHTTPKVADPFSRVVPVMLTGLYTRARVTSAAASALNGATLEQQNTGFV